MIKLINIFFLSFFFISSFAQKSTFHQLTTDSSSYFINKTNVIGSDTLTINLSRRFFGISSVENNTNTNTFIYGSGVNMKFKKLILFSSLDFISGNYNSQIINFQDSLGIIPGFGREKHRYKIHASYKINKFFNSDFGFGKHFIGDGYRSILLSDNSYSYPYLKLSTSFGKIKYYNLYTTISDIQLSNQDRKKYKAIHFLDIEINKFIRFGVFEAVLWQDRDDFYVRGFDLEYLNPIIFYRPVEFSKHSPDNVLMGSTFNINYNNTNLYGQLVLDDLNISRARDGDDGYTVENSNGFFQNKFGYQIGLKNKNKYFQALIEYNQVQPYTFAHKEPMQSYTHYNQALAHPLGANFKEFTSLVEFTVNKWNINLKFTSADVGLDSLNTHYGQNIFLSDFEAQIDGQQYSYGNFNGQGVKTRINSFKLEASYPIKWADVFGSIFYIKKKSDLIDQTSLWYSIGLRTFPFSVFRDY